MNVEKAFLWLFGPKEESGKEYTPSSFRLSNNQYFIDHPQAKILFDAGWKIEEFGRPIASGSPLKVGGFPNRKNSEGYGYKQEPDENPVAQLKKCGIEIDDIDYVVMSHLMTEHAGWLPVFSGKKAKIMVQQKEYEYAKRIAIPLMGEPPIEQFHSWMYKRQHFELPGLKYEFINGDYEIVKDITVLSTPGHTPGYQMLSVRLPKTGTVVMSPCEHLGMYYSVPINGNGPGIPHTFTWFAGGELESFKRIRELMNKEKGQIFCGHDWDQFQTLKHAPEYYE